MAKKSIYTPQNEPKKFYPTQNFFLRFYPPLLAEIFTPLSWLPARTCMAKLREIFGKMGIFWNLDNFESVNFWKMSISSFETKHF